MSTATDMVALYIAAEKAVLAGQSYAFGDRSWTLANLAEIRKGRLDWEQRAASEAAVAATGVQPRGYALAVFGRSCR